MAEPDDQMLREAARARGFRVVRSRRRKAGGDFGRYGLVDLKSGRECMGFGPDGLTASADEVLAYLRGGEVASWKRSLIGVVGEDDAKPAKKEGESTGSTARPERSRGASAPKSDRGAKRARQGEKWEKDQPARESRGRPSTSLGTSGKGGSREAKQKTKDKGGPPPEPSIREATRRDAAVLARLLGVPAATLAERLAAAIRADEPPLLAESDRLFGAVAWTIIPSLQHGPRGRITLLLVAEEERRRGIGASLLEEAERRLAQNGVAEIEMSLDIDFDAPTAFLRRTGWQRSTNGYLKSI